MYAITPYVKGRIIIDKANNFAMKVIIVVNNFVDF